MDKIPEIIKIRVFGSRDCDECEKLVKAMNMYSLDYEFIDAFEEKNQDICDKYEVDDLPCIQGYLGENKEIIYQSVGYISPVILLQNISDVQELRANPVDMKVFGVRRRTKGAIGSNKGNGKCKNCGSEKNESQSE